jgi:hypothetical protein
MEQTNNQTQSFGQEPVSGNNPVYVQLEPVPNATAVLVLGIISIATCWCYGIVGMILSIIALVLAGNGKKAYFASPEKYSQGSFNNLKAGRVCAIIGLSLSGLYLIFVILYILTLFSILSGGFFEIFENVNAFNF